MRHHGFAGIHVFVLVLWDSMGRIVLEVYFPLLLILCERGDTVSILNSALCKEMSHILWISACHLFYVTRLFFQLIYLFWSSQEESVCSLHPSAGAESMLALHPGIPMVNGPGCSLPAVVFRAGSSSQAVTKLGLKGAFAAFVKGFEQHPGSFSRW